MSRPSDDDNDDYEEYVPAKRRKADAARNAAAVASRRGAVGLAAAADAGGRSSRWCVPNRGEAEKQRGQASATAAAPTTGTAGGRKTLLDEAAELKARFEVQEQTDAQRMAEAEAHLLAEVEKKTALKSVAELASGVLYTEPMKSSWRAPRFLLDAPASHHDAVREQHHVLVEGEDVPPCCVSFAEMKLPKPIMRELKRRGIKRPTPIQMQGLPAVLAGRDLIGISFTGSGKTMVFALPMLVVAWEEEKRVPIRGGQGPSGVIICPSRELARQTHEIVVEFCGAIAAHTSAPSRRQPVQLRPLLVIGGTQVDRDALRQGVHTVVATPGRLLDLLRKRQLTFERCKYVCLDEADRLIDLGFEEDVRAIFDFFSAQRQTLMFSATMPTKIRNFASSALVKPVVVNVGRAGAASLNIKQEIEIVRPEARIVQLLQALQKTEPPVLIFAENKSDVDEIHEYLLLKCVDAVSVHGSKDQEERELAMREFRAGKKHVLVATDVAAKGIDLVGIKHVINFDLPEAIEFYTHRIGRTGRGGERGLATTFVSSNDSPSALADLMQLLVEAKQVVPAALLELVPDETSAAFAGAAAAAAEEVGGVRGCAYCGGLGHRVQGCPKLQAEKLKAHAASGGGGARTMADRGGAGAYGGEW
jgi:ATP-dependent RNA helicase DDX41